MPSAISSLGTEERITKFTNCRLVKGDELVYQDLWVSSLTGRIVRSQEAFYSENAVPDETIDLGGRIVAPGLIDVQLNGAFGFNFSTIPDDPLSYGKMLRQMNKLLVQTGVTSYLPTVTSSRKEVYHQVCPPILVPSYDESLMRIVTSSSRPFRKIPSPGRWQRVTWCTCRRAIYFKDQERNSSD